MLKKCGVHFVGWLLLIIGGLNWGLVGLGYFFNGDWNVVALLFGTWPIVEAIIYILVGIAAVAMLFERNCKSCHVESSNTAAPII
jgi:uncharacterized protein